MVQKDALFYTKPLVATKNGAERCPFAHRTLHLPFSRCRKCHIFAPFSPGGNFWCMKTLLLAPNRTRHNKWCRKIPIRAPNPTSPILPVQKMPHFCTIFPRRQLLVQENTPFGTKPHSPQKMVKKDTHSRTKPLSTTRNGAESYPIPFFRVNTNLSPPPGLLDTEIFPPWNCTACLTMESPSPVPPTWRERPLSIL